MSRIAGVVDFKEDIKLYTESYLDMRNTLGGIKPAVDDIYITDNICFMQSTLDKDNLQNTKPLVFKQYNKDFTIILSGNLYNAKELIAELNLDKATSDREIIIYSYLKWGNSFLEKLNGSFAFALWDNNTHTLIIARDRLGVQPLFYYFSGNKLIFASEIKTLLKHPLIKPEIDKTAIAEIMLIGPGRTSGYGIFNGIDELKPANIAIFTNNNINVYAYWQLKAKQHTQSFDETKEYVKTILIDSINTQKANNNSICTFLSGGLDSSIISTVSGVKNTFSIDYEENDKYFQPTKFQPNSDNAYIKIMTDFLKTNHTTITIDTDDLVDSLFLAVEARDLPGMADVDGSMLLLCKEVKKHFSTAISGECADEFFGGYPWYRDKDIRNIDGFPWSQSTEYRTSFIKKEILGDINPVDYVYSKYLNTVNSSSTLDNESALEKRMKEMFNLNSNWFMQTLIDRTDRMSMYSGFDVKIPFCDYRIVEYIYNVPWEFKDYKGREKGLLRSAMEGILPEDVLWRKKSPFPKTHNPKYLKKVSDILSDIIASPNAPILDILKKEELENIINSEKSVAWYGQLMNTPQTIAYFIQINHWLSHYNIKII